MARSTRRFLLPAVLALFAALISADRLATPVAVQAIFDPAGPAFDPLSTFSIGDSPAAVPQPPRILAGTNSHGLPANATTRNGYCIDVNVDGVTPVGPDMGFRLVASNPLPGVSPPTVVVPIPGEGTYVDGAVVGAGTSAANTTSGGSANDVFCVVATAPPGYKTLTIEWNYDQGGVQPPKTLVVPIVNLSLKKVGDGLVGGPAEVCTVGWDGAFLTGANSNLSNATDPDPVNVLDSAIATAPPPRHTEFPDFVITGGANSPYVAYQRQSGTEWCAGIASSGEETGLGVSLNLHAVYNRVNIGLRSRNFDDQPVTVTLPADQAVDIAASVELRHITLDGQISQKQTSDPKVIYSIHYICLIGTDSTAGDALTASGVHFNPQNPPQTPTVASLTTFVKSGTDDPRLGGVDDNTLCLSYTSSEPGEHSVFVNFTDNGVPATASFDTNNDGNGADLPGGPLITAWNNIDRTVISTNSATDGVVTFTEVQVPLRFNLADGTFLATARFSEWVLGKHTTNGAQKLNQLLDGTLIRAEIIGNCGFFVTPDWDNFGTQVQSITGISVGGRFELNDFTGDPFGNAGNAAFGDVDAAPDDINISTQNAGGCGANYVSRVRINVYYPGPNAGPATDEEWVDMRFTYTPPQKIPRVAWAGEFVNITYAVSSDDSCAGRTVHFVRPNDQSGTFIADAGITLHGPDHATADFGSGCSATVRYESEAPGEVDIEVFVDPVVGSPAFTKVAHPIFFMLFEDIAVDATPDQFVSSFGDVSANVRGYFVGSNPSGRPAETKPDGRNVPADRWILPDDWELLKGQSDLRSALGSLDMPSAIVTFLMQNEGVVNGYKSGVKTGAAGFFIPDDVTDFAFNFNPHTNVPSILGTSTRPRMMSQPSTTSGEASVDTFGDRNLSYEGCAANVITGNPHCKPEDIAGRTTYYAVAEYPEARNRGKFPAVSSNVSETVWRWAGFKDVTVLNTDSPQIKYVVAHLRDRDGFCDAANANNTLGVPVRFEIDAGGGAIIEAADRPFTINGTRRFASATTFDTQNLLGEPINTHIAKPPLFADSPDECQAWIKITNSLLVPTNVTVKFPPPPSPIPGDIRVTDLQCNGAETITVKNFGNNEVNLGGFGLESAGEDVGNAEQLDLIGILQPGESKTFLGGPGATSNGWLDVQNEVFVGANDYVQLVWEDYPLTTVLCDGQKFENSPLVTLPLDGEGEIQVDVVIPFGQETQVPLVAGWNLVPTGEGTVSLETAFGEFKEFVDVIYVWDPVVEEWSHYIPDAPAGVNTITEIGNGAYMWVLVNTPFTLTLPN